MLDQFLFLSIILGGFALFIYGIHQMSDGLKSIAGHKVRAYIEKYTSNLFMAVTVGTIITAILHSSAAVTVISISLVRSGLMRLEQAIGITIGANIGTCATSILVGLDIEQFSYVFIFIGIALMLLTKKKKTHYIGQVVFGFGIIFAGLQIMGDQLISISTTSWFLNTMELLGKNPWLALLGGTIATALIQSSTALIGIVQMLFTTGAIAPTAAIAFIYGANVGTTLTAIIAGAGGSIATKRAAWFHVVYNIAGALLGMLILSPYVELTQWVNNAMQGGPEMFVAQAHFIFNVASTILVFPFVKQCVRLLTILIPGEDPKGAVVESIDQLDDSLPELFPAAALEVSKKNILRMGRNVKANIDLSLEYLNHPNQETADQIIEIEALINQYDEILAKYLLKITQQPILSKDQNNEAYKDYQIIKNLERIGDLVINLIEAYQLVHENHESFSEDAKKDLMRMYQKLDQMLSTSMSIYDTRKLIPELDRLNHLEMEINTLETKNRERHFYRLSHGICEYHIAASVFVDILSNLERLGDHCLNIANITIMTNKDHNKKFLDARKYAPARKQKKGKHMI